MNFEMDVVFVLANSHECEREKGSFFKLSETSYQTRGSGKLCELATRALTKLAKIVCEMFKFACQRFPTYGKLLDKQLLFADKLEMFSEFFSTSRRLNVTVTKETYFTQGLTGLKLLCVLCQEIGPPINKVPTRKVPLI